MTDLRREPTNSFPSTGDIHAEDDCAIHALAMVAGISYDAAKSMLRGGSTDAARLLSSLSVERITFPSAKGSPRMTPRAFCQKYPKGTFVVKSAGHVFVVRDGKSINLSEKPAHNCVYAAWRVSRAA